MKRHLVTVLIVVLSFAAPGAAHAKGKGILPIVGSAKLLCDGKGTLAWTATVKQPLATQVVWVMVDNRTTIAFRRATTAGTYRGVVAGIFETVPHFVTFRHMVGGLSIEQPIEIRVLPCGR